MMWLHYLRKWWYGVKVVQESSTALYNASHKTVNTIFLYSRILASYLSDDLAGRKVPLSNLSLGIIIFATLSLDNTVN